MDEDSVLKYAEENILLINYLEDVDDVDEEHFSDSETIVSGAAETNRPHKNQFKMPAHLRGLMGEANVRFAKGELEISQKMCFELIRQAPNVPEPYETLAQIYENTNHKKYKAFLMIACHLRPSNETTWCRLAELELQENNYKAAVQVYSQAIKGSPGSVDLHVKRLKLAQEKAANKTSLVPHFKLSLAKVLPRDQSDEILRLCSEVARYYYNARNYTKAIDALRICIKRVPHHMTPDILNMMLELLLLSERYSECLDIFTQFCGFQFDVTVGEDMSIMINSYEIPPSLHIDLKTKFIVCLIGLHSYHLVEALIADMTENADIETHGMLYLDIAEALMQSSYFQEALNILLALVKSRNYSLAAVWLKHAECLAALKLYDQAIDAYNTVIKLAPNHVDVLYPLAMLLLKQERRQEALEVLSQDLSAGKLHVATLIEQMKLLKQIGDLENYWKCSELLLSRHCPVLKHYDELRVVTLQKASHKEKMSKISRIRSVKGENDCLDFNLESVCEPSVPTEYKLYLEILEFAWKNKAYDQLQKFAFMGMASTRFGKMLREICLIACHACLYNRDYYHGFHIARDLLLNYHENSHAWNLYSLLTHKSQEIVKVNRFFDSVTIRNKIPQAIAELIKANHCCDVGQYPQCLNYFIKEYRLNKTSYSAFMIGVAMLQQYTQRKKNSVNKKVMVEMASYLFYNYAKIRSKYADQEVYYNLGRMYQQIGVNHLAEYFYKKVFKVQNEILDKYGDYVDIKMEAAYNLHLIYKASGNSIAARKILCQYIVI